MPTHRRFSRRDSATNNSTTSSLAPASARITFARQVDPGFLRLLPSSRGTLLDFAFERRGVEAVIRADVDEIQEVTRREEFLRRVGSRRGVDGRRRADEGFERR